jgi:hypothetical protein
MDLVSIEYRFEFGNDQQIATCKLRLDPQCLVILDELPGPLPAWTRLAFHQCSNCPLQPKTDPYCPAAVNMVDIVSRFGDLLSYDQIKVIVVTDERTIYSHTTVQRAVCSLMGLLMAGSGCPKTAFFKPMARFHLPFASTEETIWRATSCYLMTQYFLKQDGKIPDVKFAGLRRIYDEIQTVNMAFAKRLRAVCQHDSMVNAIILLDMFAKSMPTAIEESLGEIRHLFVPFLSK